VPGARERGPHGARSGRERQGPVEEADRLPGLSDRQLDGAEPEERERRSGIEFQRLPVPRRGRGPVTEFFQ